MTLDDLIYDVCVRYQSIAEEKGLASDQESMWLWAVGYYDQDTGGACKMGEEVPNFFDVPAQPPETETEPEN